MFCVFFEGIVEKNGKFSVLDNPSTLITYLLRFINDNLKKWKSVYKLIFKYKKVVCLNPK